MTSKVVVFTHLTLDGVMQAPADPDEDRSGGFPYGGWEPRYADPVMAEAIASSMKTSGALFLGRKTWEHFKSVWPDRPDTEFSKVLDRTTKYVASRTLKEPLSWVNSVLVDHDLPGTVKRIKDRLEGRDLVVLGSGILSRSLMAEGLVDEYVLHLHPIVLGTGRRLFDHGTPHAPLKLVDVKPTGTGVLIATYRPER